MELKILNIQGLNNVFEIDVFHDEFSDAVNEAWKKDPPFMRYQRKLIQDLAVLIQEKERAIALPQFEKLKNTKGIYSIKHPETRKNVRVLYYISDEEDIILLTAFLEKNDNDYKIAISRAEKRRDWLLS